MTTARWIEYRGVRYDLTEATQQATIGTLLELHRVAGMSVRKVSEVLIGMGDMTSILDVFDSPERLEVWPAMLFLCKRKAGDADFTWEQALSVSLYDVHLVIDEPGEADADPKVSDPRTPDESDGEEPTTSSTT